LKFLKKVSIKGYVKESLEEENARKPDGLQMEGRSRCDHAPLKKGRTVAAPLRSRDS